MEGKPQQGRTLNRLSLDAFDSVDIEEMVFVVIRDKALHLLRTHTPIRLRNVDDREIQIREDIHARPQDGQNGRKAQGNYKNENCNRASERCANEPHGVSSSFRRIL